MANTDPFNYDLDKITERETVFDFVSRLPMGLDFINQDYNGAENSDDKQVILPRNIKLKDGVLMQIIRTLAISDKLHLDRLRTSYKNAPVGTKTVSIIVPSNATLYKIVQEKTGQDVTVCFTKSDNIYSATFDVPMINQDTFKAYYTV